MKTPWWQWILLIGILGLAWWLRGTSLWWDDGYQLHPDERFLRMTVEKLTVPEALTDYLDSQRSSLNPRNHGVEHFAYGTLPTTLWRVAGEGQGVDNARQWLLLGRRISAVADCITVLLTFFWGWLLVQRGNRFGAGLIAAALYALCVLAIQQAHFFTVDVLCTLFVTLTLVAATAYLRYRRVVWLVVAGAGCGAALGCKISVLPLLLLVGALLGLEIFLRRVGWRRGLVMLAVFYAATFLTWRVASPDVFAGSGHGTWGFAKNWLEDVNFSRKLGSGEIDTPPSFQWADRIPFIWPFYNLILWGMGGVPGLAACAAIVAAWWTLGRQAKDAWLQRNGTGLNLKLLLLVLWQCGMFLALGGQFVASMRYFLPLCPCLFVGVAWWFSNNHVKNWIRWGVLACAATWAWCFTGIYNEQHSRVQASEWLMQHVPAGSSISHEYWDDRLPLWSADETFPENYQFVEMRWTDEDTPEKLELALDWLEQTDFLVISSDRARLTLPRISVRFPMAAKYYSELIAGNLGFEHVSSFQVVPKILGLALNTPAWAEEAFSVYDHPHVNIFRKQSSFDREQARRVLGDVNWGRVVHVPSRMAKEAHTGLLLSEKRWDQQVNGGTWREVFSSKKGRGISAAFLWLLVVSGLGVLVWPWVFHLASGLPDRAWFLTKITGLLVFGWLWWFGSSSGWGRSWAWMVGTLSAGTGLGIAGWWWQRKTLLNWLRLHWPEVLKVEGIFLIFFVLMVGYRGMNPDLWHAFYGGEKMMDTAYFTAVIKAESFPPHQPWFSGGFINYYYFGFVPPALLAKLTGTTPEVATQLALSVWFALVAVMTYGVMRMLGNKAWVRWLALAMMLVAGSWNQWKLLFKDGRFYQGEWFWSASRGFETPKDEAGVITEFPFFTFLFGDLHAHLLSMPVFLLVIALVIIIVRAEPTQKIAFSGITLLAALAWGALSAGNTWDTPAATLLLLGALGIACFRGVLSPMRAVGLLLLGTVVAWLAFLPFHHWFASGYGSASLWMGSKTRLEDYLLHYGTVFAMAGVGAGFLLWKKIEFPWLKTWQWVVLVSGAVSGVYFLGGGATAGILALMVFFVVVCYSAKNSVIGMSCGLLAFVALLVALVPEWIVVDGDVGRMNTVFKLHLQSWMLLALVMPLCLMTIADSLSSVRGKRWFACGVILALLPAFFYPITATAERLKQRFHEQTDWTLDGLAFLEDAEYRQGGRTLRLKHDYRVIQWLRKHVNGTPVIAEAQTVAGRYDWNSRISTFTGLPTPVGWQTHLGQQRRGLPGDELKNRVEDMRTLFNTADTQLKIKLLRRYSIRYVVVTHLERAVTNPEGLAAFDAMPELHKVLSGQAARIYEVDAGIPPHSDP